jgi:HEPN domain-containing protein
MREEDELHTILAEWVEKAEADLASAVRLLAEKEAWAAETICFHAQQCVEKYLKTMLVLARIDFPRTHDVRRLMGMLPSASRPDLSQAERDTLTPYATVTRYPTGLGPLHIRQARQAVAMARRVRKHARSVLPRPALRRRRN